MSYVKKKVAMFLCALLAFTMAFGVVPTQEVKANTVIGFQLKGLSRTENLKLAKGRTYTMVADTTYSYNSNHYDASWLDGTKSSFKAK